MAIPVWVTLTVGIAALLYGAYRIRWSFRPRDESDTARPRRGMAAMSATMHRFVGIVYALLGAALIAASFGWSPIAGLLAPKQPAKPVEKGIQMEQKKQPPAPPATPPPAPAEQK